MKPHLSRDRAKWAIRCEPYVYHATTFAQACEVARRVIGPDRHLPEFMWLETPAR